MEQIIKREPKIVDEKIVIDSTAHETISFVEFMNVYSTKVAEHAQLESDIEKTNAELDKIDENLKIEDVPAEFITNFKKMIAYQKRQDLINNVKALEIKCAALSDEIISLNPVAQQLSARLKKVKEEPK